ncbi:acetylxylan esterase [Spirosoma daeguense]
MDAFLFWLTIVLLTTSLASAQNPEGFNYDEAKVGTYTLPEPLINKAGKPVKSKSAWADRRAELLQLFAENVYGHTPKQNVKLRFETKSVNDSALNGLAVRKLVSIFFVDYPQIPSIDVALYLPKNTKSAPVFLGLNFVGNQGVTTEIDVPITTRWVANAPGDVAVENKSTEKSRGRQASRWQLETILKRGYGVATVYYGDIEPDHPKGWQGHIRSIMGSPSETAPYDGKNWGAIGAWAWGLSRILDYLQTEPAVDSKRVIVIGHSRLGKAALWAGAQDERFAAVISNESGEGGAALSRRWYGETVERINTSFPHWFNGQYKTYNKRVADLPVDQHELLALIAPRPLYVASAEEDRWSDPKGEFLGAMHTESVYKLFGKTGLGTTTFPGVNQPIGQTVRYHNRTGIHDVTAYDWEQYLKFADELVGR